MHNTSRNFWMIALCWSAAAGPLAATASGGGKAPRKPNVVLLFIDDLGYGDTGPYGCRDIPTPHIDRLAREGVTCTASYVTNPPCCPSRCSLIMGMYGQRFGKYGMSRGLPIPDDKPALAEFMRGRGYVTGQIGKWDIGTKAQGPLTRGFAEVAMRPKPKRYADPSDAPAALRKKRKGRSKYVCVTEGGKEAWLTDVNGDQMVEFVERNKDKPFFLYFSPEAVHSPSGEAPPRLTKRAPKVKKANRKRLAGSIISVDDQVGKLLAVLEKHNLRRDTLVIFSSDNGANASDGGSPAPYRGGKGRGTQQEGWVRIPTIFSYPGVIPQGKKYHGLTCTLDYYATLAALGGGSAPEHLDGVNMIPYLRGDQTGAAHEFLFWLNNDPADAKRRHLIAARWKDWRLYKPQGRDWQLFNLRLDPKEERDVAAGHPAVVETMKARHAAWAKTLAPLAKVPARGRPSGRAIPAGTGWVYANR